MSAPQVAIEYGEKPGRSQPALRLLEEQELWDRYRQGGDLEARDALVARYWWLVEQEARRFQARIARSSSAEAMMSAGGVGLLQAVERFDPERGLRFSGYALPRIRGAMRDDWRSSDWMPRLARRRNRLLQAATRRVEGRLGRRAEVSEVAAELSLDLPGIWRWEAQASRGAVELDSVATCERPADAVGQVLPASSLADPELDLMTAERRRRIGAELDRLPERERRVLSMAYFEELSGIEIATLLGVSAARVSQLRSQGIERLRAAASLREYA